MKAFVLIGRLAILSLILVTLTAPVHAEIKIRMAGQYAQDHPATKAQKEFKRLVEKGTEGEIKIRIYPANQLGDYTQVYDEVSRGTIDSALISVPSQSDSRFELIYLQYLAKNTEEGKEVYAPGGYLFQTLDKIHAKLNVKFLGFHAEGMGIYALKRLPDNWQDPSAKKNMLIRAAPFKIFKVAAEERGFGTVTIPYSDLYTAMQTGVVEGWDGGPADLNYHSFRDVIKQVIVTNHFFETTSFLFNKDLWDSLKPEQRQVIAESTKKISMSSFDRVKDKDEFYLNRLAESKVKINRLSNKELESWASHTRSIVWPQLRDRLGDEIIDNLEEVYKIKYK